jgi:hypothetical protein
MGNTFRNYLPLMIVVLFAFVMSFAIYEGRGQFHTYIFMNSAMGFFLCLLSMFKLFDIADFVEGFRTYDIIAKQFLIYGYLYPFIELSLGLSFLGHQAPLVTNVVMLIVMTISAIGVVKNVIAGIDVHCRCLGTILKVPLSTVSIVENISMGIMAAINILLLILN